MITRLTYNSLRANIPTAPPQTQGHSLEDITTATASFKALAFLLVCHHINLLTMVYSLNREGEEAKGREEGANMPL